MTNYYKLFMALNVGDKAPNFELVDTELKMRTLDEFIGKKIILSFFVAASSPVCETEMCTFRDSWDEISKLGAQVVAISNDGPFANIIPKNAIIGSVAVFSKFRIVLPHAYKKIAITSNMTNIRMKE